MNDRNFLLENSRTSLVQNGILMALSFPLAWVLVRCLRLPDDSVVLLPMVLVVYLVQQNGLLYRKAQRENLKWILPFAILLSFFVTLAFHIDPSNAYSLVADHNAFSSLSALDPVSFVAMTYLFSLALVWVFAAGFRRSKETYTSARLRTGIRKEQRKVMLVLAAVLFLAWLPYFLVYYPGLIYGDSMNSITEAMHQAAYENHFPLFYTLFVELCLKIGMAFADITVGCAIYTLVQMAGLALLLAYMLCWMDNKGVPRVLTLFSLLMFGVVRYFPQHAVSMWKDPFFSAGLMFYSLKLFDLLASEGALGKSRKFLLQCVLSIVVICLSRNNGVYIIAFCMVLLFLIAAARKNLRVYRRMVLLHLISVLCILVLTGPVYSKLGIGKDDVESFGIPLQQLARTVAYDGNISEQDKEFLDNILPLERWKEVYTPALVDPIKWDAEFDKDFFSRNKGEFLMVWLRTLLKNPVRYVEAWCLTTYGYWAPNLWELSGYEQNLTSGNLNAVAEWYIDFGIRQTNLTGSDWLQEICSLTTTAPSSGLLTWVVLFMVLFALIKGCGRYCLFFAPALGNLITLLLASPSAYWPRYALVYLYMLPVIFLFPLLLRGERKTE